MVSIEVGSSCCCLIARSFDLFIARSLVFSISLDVAPASPFIASKWRARVTFVVKGKNERERQKKGGLERGRPPPYPVGAVPFYRGDMWGIDLLASPSVGATCHGHALTCMPLWHEGGRCVRPSFHGEGVRWHSCHHPHCCRGMDIVVVE
jgi:hypothetical protein